MKRAGKPIPAVERPPKNCGSGCRPVGKCRQGMERARFTIYDNDPYSEHSQHVSLMPISLELCDFWFIDLIDLLVINMLNAVSPSCLRCFKVRCHQLSAGFNMSLKIPQNLQITYLTCLNHRLNHRLNTVHGLCAKADAAHLLRTACFGIDPVALPVVAELEDQASAARPLTLGIIWDSGAKCASGWILQWTEKMGTTHFANFVRLCAHVDHPSRARVSFFSLVCHFRGLPGYPSSKSPDFQKTPPKKCKQTTNFRKQILKWSYRPFYILYNTCKYQSRKYRTYGVVLDLFISICIFYVVIFGIYIKRIYVPYIVYIYISFQSTMFDRDTWWHPHFLGCKTTTFQGKTWCFIAITLPYHGTGCDGLLELQCGAKGKLRPQVAHETWRRRSKQKWE